jgi:hypothetical protein
VASEVSGPGQFSARTDKAVTKANESLPNAGYGEAKDYQDQKSGAAMGQSPGGMDLASMFGNPSAQVTGLGEPTAQPGVPVTDGAALGAGAGTEALNTPGADQESKAYNAAYMVALKFLANQPGSSDAARNIVRAMQASM